MCETFFEKPVCLDMHRVDKHSECRNSGHWIKEKVELKMHMNKCYSYFTKIRQGHHKTYN